MKRYLLFAWRTYYPDGGWNDLRGSFVSVNDAQDAFALIDETEYIENGQIIDSSSWSVLLEAKRQFDEGGPTTASGETVEPGGVSWDAPLSPEFPEVDDSAEWDWGLPGRDE